MGLMFLKLAILAIGWGFARETFNFPRWARITGEIAILAIWFVAIARYYK